MTILPALESPTLKFSSTELLVRIRAEYSEMPGLKLTVPQARRLWTLDCATCDAALAALVEAKFLTRTREGLFIMARTDRSDQKHRGGSGTPDSVDPVGGCRRSPLPSLGGREISFGDRLPSRKSA